MKKQKYSAFTLVEMLIVMGILSVLMAIGVSVARFAIQRANNIQHQNAVDQMFQAMQSYYTDERRYPTTTQFVSFEAALNGGVLDKYVDSNFDGGSPTVLYYISSNTTAPQVFLVCASYGDTDVNTVADNLGGYCNGNGFGDSTLLGGQTIDQKVFEQGGSSAPPAEPTWGNFLTWIGNASSHVQSSYWNGSSFGAIPVP